MGPRYRHQRESYIDPAARRRYNEIIRLNFSNIFISATVWFLAMVAAVDAQTPAVTGNVRDQNGAAVVGAKVILRVPGRPDLVATTDTNGAFRIEFEPDLKATIRVSAPSFSDHVEDVRSAEITIELQAAAVSESVNVTRVGSRLADTPASVVALDQPQLRTDPSPTLDDKLRQVPGFSLFRRSGSRTANPTTQGVSLRGTGGSGASRAAVTIDGFPLNDPFGGWIHWGRVPLESVESVEVFRGAAGELYGSSAIGGIVSIETRPPSDKLSVNLETFYGSQRSPSLSFFSTAGRGRISGSLAAEAFSTDGSIVVADDQRGIIDTRAGVNRVSAIPTVQFAFGKTSRAFASFQYFLERRKNGTPLQTNDTRLLNARLGVDVSSANFGSFSFRAWLLSQVYHQSFSSVAADRNSESLTRLQTVPSQAGGLSVLWSTNLSSTGSLFAGAETRLVRGSSDETGFAAGQATSLIGSGGREVTFGMFTGVNFSPLDRFVFSGGIRFDHWREYSTYTASRSLTTGQFSGMAFAERSESAVSPRASVLYRITRGVSATGSVSTGFRQPTLNELYRSFRVGNVLTLANENLRAERALSGEGGVLISQFGDRLYVRAVAFCNRISKPVANVTLTATPTLITRQRQNLGSTRTCGFEADAQWRIRNDLEFSGGYLFADARIRNFPVDARLVGLRIPQVARNQFTLRARYSNERIADIAVQFRASDAQFDDDLNLFRLRAFGTTDLFVSRMLNKRIVLFFAAENIFDSTIEAGRTPVLTSTGPRAVRAGVRIRLGSSAH